MPNKSIAAKCLALSGLFEAELLTELMLRYWNHPFAADSTFRHQLLEMAVEVLKASVGGEQFIEDIEPTQMNFVTSIWYAEWNSASDMGEESAAERKAWLEAVRRALPSCFCSQDRLQ